MKSIVFCLVSQRSSRQNGFNSALRKESQSLWELMLHLFSNPEEVLNRPSNFACRAQKCFSEIICMHTINKGRKSWSNVPRRPSFSLKWCNRSAKPCSNPTWPAQQTIVCSSTLHEQPHEPNQQHHLASSNQHDEESPSKPTKTPNASRLQYP